RSYRTFRVALVSDAWSQQIRSHVERHIGRIDRVFPGDSRYATADVLHISPVASRPYHTLVSAGMSNVAMRVPPDVDAPRRLELMMTLPEGWKPSSDQTDEPSHWPTRLLQSLSRLPREREGWLGWGHTVPNGDPPQPLAPQTQLCGVIVAPSLLVPVAFYELNIDGERIAFYSAIPLYMEEMALHARAGMAALLERLLHNDINDVVYLKRKNVAKKKRFGLF
ncbi:MAG: suppressor of fused domain protein, partial [Steroidobacteraceae bacterium]